MPGGERAGHIFIPHGHSPAAWRPSAHGLHGQGDAADQLPVVGPSRSAGRSGAVPSRPGGAERAGGGLHEAGQSGRGSGALPVGCARSGQR